jgi:hypothetical protein
MTDLDDLYAQIPVDQIASKVGAAPGEVDDAVKTLVPVLLGGFHHSSDDADSASRIELAANQHAQSGLLDGGVSVDQVDEQEGQQAVARVFGGNDVSQVASALSDAGAGKSELIKKLLPIITPIVLAYIGKKLAQKGGPGSSAESSGGGLGDILGSILGGGRQSADDPLGAVLGNILGGGKGGSIGDVLGGLIRGGK